MNTPMTPRKRLQGQFEVSTEAQGQELSAACQEIINGKRTRLLPAAEDLTEIM